MCFLFSAFSVLRSHLPYKMYTVIDHDLLYIDVSTVCEPALCQKTPRAHLPSPCLCNLLRRVRRWQPHRPRRGMSAPAPADRADRSEQRDAVHGTGWGLRLHTAAVGWKDGWSAAPSVGQEHCTMAPPKAVLLKEAVVLKLLKSNWG